mgnify:CR=1 FL=1
MYLLYVSCLVAVKFQGGAFLWCRSPMGFCVLFDGLVVGLVGGLV